ncbi:LuxE/PaaK family acyltransferase [Anaeromyxobacter paludicola]|uniref:Acyl-protein synthetase n=1 Tax=Anaeromyxobacter paludicola TaxID=2918171 RepID=A0ABM7XAJ4_9BACT|nr:hypothetical protein [Anaeromyxobacter paludicola]BDG08836.1 acyl-protein synthetase [Anaeromyxobacter paludicola]
MARAEESAGAAESRRAGLAQEIRAVLQAGCEGDPAPFERLALAEFAYQFEQNGPYRRFCEAKGATPDRVRAWGEIPAFPTAAFKSEIVASFPMERAVFELLTSGTTSPEVRGKVFRDELGRELVFRANRMVTAAWLFPDFDPGRRCRLLLMTPSPKMAPSMGMAVAMERTRVEFGTEDSCFLIGPTGLDVRALARALTGSERSGVPVALVGATSAFVFFFEACRGKGVRFRLPPGSRVCDGGGYRGRFGELTREGYLSRCEEILGVPSTHCVNVLGMSETGTNYADNVLGDLVAGRPPRPRRKVPPPWTRVQAMSLEDLSPLPPGEVGLLRHYDLVNLPMVLGVQTDNLGWVDGEGGFEIVGRAAVRDGKVTPLPSERAVGPMGDRRIFRFLEGYVNFSIQFKMGRFRRRPAGR